MFPARCPCGCPGRGTNVSLPARTRPSQASRQEEVSHRLAANSSGVLAARISYLIDDLLCDPRLRESQRMELMRVRARFQRVADAPADRQQGGARGAPARRR